MSFINSKHFESSFVFVKSRVVKNPLFSNTPLLRISENIGVRTFPDKLIIDKMMFWDIIVSKASQAGYPSQFLWLAPLFYKER